MTFVQVRQPRVSSKEVSKKTLRERSRRLRSVRTTISMGESSSQLANEVSCLPVEERNAIAAQFDETPGQLRVVLPTSTSLAMKADLNITWSKLDIIRR